MKANYNNLITGRAFSTVVVNINKSKNESKLQLSRLRRLQIQVVVNINKSKNESKLQLIPPISKFYPGCCKYQ